MSDSMDVQEKFATACKDGNLEAARQILLQDWEVGDINVNFRDNKGNTPLILASMNGKLAIVQWLLEGARVDVNVSNNFGTTALMESAIQGHQEIIKCLLQYGADVNLLANNGFSAYQCAKTDEIRKFLVEHRRMSSVKSNYFGRGVNNESCVIDNESIQVATPTSNHIGTDDDESISSSRKSLVLRTSRICRVSKNHQSKRGNKKENNLNSLNHRNKKTRDSQRPVKQSQTKIFDNINQSEDEDQEIESGGSRRNSNQDKKSTDHNQNKRWLPRQLLYPHYSYHHQYYPDMDYASDDSQSSRTSIPSFHHYSIPISHQAVYCAPPAFPASPIYPYHYLPLPSLGPYQPHSLTAANVPPISPVVVQSPPLPTDSPVVNQRPSIQIIRPASSDDQAIYLHHGRFPERSLESFSDKHLENPKSSPSWLASLSPVVEDMGTQTDNVDGLSHSKFHGSVSRKPANGKIPNHSRGDYTPILKTAFCGDAESSETDESLMSIARNYRSQRKLLSISQDQNQKEQHEQFHQFLLFQKFQQDQGKSSIQPKLLSQSVSTIESRELSHQQKDLTENRKVPLVCEPFASGINRSESNNYYVATLREQNSGTLSAMDLRPIPLIEEEDDNDKSTGWICSICVPF